MDLKQWAQRWAVSPEAMFELDKILIQDITPIVPGLPTYSEQDVQQSIRLQSSRSGARLWRNNVGAVTTEDNRHIRFGLANESSKMNKRIKSSDLIGITPVNITADHIGKTLGVFTSIEVKRPGWKYTGTEREEAQRAWLNLIINLHGFATFATNATEINKFIGDITP